MNQQKWKENEATEKECLKTLHTPTMPMSLCFWSSSTEDAITKNRKPQSLITDLTARWEGREMRGEGEVGTKASSEQEARACSSKIYPTKRVSCLTSRTTFSQICIPWSGRHYSFLFRQACKRPQQAQGEFITVEGVEGRH